MSKRRKGYPSETQVKRGVRVVHGDKELHEKVGRNDPCPCGSGKLFKKCCRNTGGFRRRQPPPLLSASDARRDPPARDLPFDELPAGLRQAVAARRVTKVAWPDGLLT